MPDGRRLRAGVVGVGYLGALHAQKYAELEDVDLVAVFDSDGQRAEQVAADVGCTVASSLEDLLGRVDAVSVAVPTAAHAEVGRRAARAGVHMLVEKPLAATSEEGRDLAEAARRAGVTLQVGHLERFNPVFDEVHRVVASPRFIECHRLSPFAGRGADTDVVFEVMIHDLDILAFLVGREIASVEAVGVPVLSGNVDIANARIRFEGGCIANVTASRVSLKRERKLRVFQEDAYVSMDFDARTALIAKRRDDVDAAAVAATSPMDAIVVEQRTFDDGDPLMAELAAFARCARTGQPPVVGVDEGLSALAMADRVMASLEVPATV